MTRCNDFANLRHGLFNFHTAFVKNKLTPEKTSSRDESRSVLYLVQFTGNDRQLYFADGFGDLDLTRAGFGAVVRGVTTGDAVCFREDLQAFVCGFIAAVKDEAVRCDNGSRAIIFIAGPERWAGCGAGRAQNALGGLIETGALFR